MNCLLCLMCVLFRVLLSFASTDTHDESIKNLNLLDTHDALPDLNIEIEDLLNLQLLQQTDNSDFKATYNFSLRTFDVDGENLYADIYTLFTWKGEVFILKASQSGFTVSWLSSGTEEEISPISIDFDMLRPRIDFFKIFDEDGVLQVVQASSEGLIFLSKVDIFDIASKENSLVKQFPGTVTGVHTLLPKSHVPLIAVVHIEEEESWLTVLSSFDLSEVAVVKIPCTLVTDIVETTTDGERILFTITSVEGFFQGTLNFKEGTLVVQQLVVDITNVSATVTLKSESINALILFKNNGQHELLQLHDFEVHLLNGLNSTIVEFADSVATSSLIGIFTVQEGNLNLYAIEDGWTLKEIKSIPLNCVTKDMQVAYSEDLLVVLLSCTEAFFHVYSLDLTPQTANVDAELGVDNAVSFSDEQSFNKLENYLKTQKLEMVKMQRILDEDLFLATDRDQTWDGPISFGSVQVQGNIRAMRFKRGLSDESHVRNNELLDRLKLEILELENTLVTMENKLDNLLSYEEDQAIYTSLDISRLASQSLHIFSKWDISKINNLSTDSYDEFLHLEKDQTLEGDFHFQKIVTENIDLNSFQDTNGNTINPRDFLQTNKPAQMVTGKHQFSYLEVVEDISPLDGMNHLKINGIRTDEIILNESDVQFMDTKTFKKQLLIEDHLMIDHLNNKKYDSLLDTFARVTNGKTLFDSVIVKGNLTVMGNVKVTSLNGYNISQLETNSIRYSLPEQQIIGPLHVESLTADTMQLDVINGIKWSELLRSDDKEVTAKIHIKDAILLGDLNSDSINGLDLSEDVVLKDVHQTIEGHLIFIDNVTVIGPEGVTLSDGVTINGIDLSNEESVTANYSVITHPVDLSYMELNCDIQAATLAGYIPSTLETHYWRKSRLQTIPFSFTALEAIFKNSVSINTLNSIELGNYLRSDIPQSVIGMNYFTETVSLPRLDISDGHTIDGVDVHALRENAISLHEKQIITGTLNFSEVKVDDLYLKDDIINGINIMDDLIHSKNSKHFGKLNFLNTVLMNQLVVEGNLDVDVINDYSASSIFKDPRSSIREIKGTLILENLDVNEVNVEGKINERNFKDLLDRSLRKTSIDPQIVSGTLTLDDVFLKDVSFEYVNGRNFKEYLNNVAKLCSGCRIGGTKTFLSSNIVADNLEAEKINGINLRGLESRLLSKSKEQIVTGQYSFTNGIVAVGLNVSNISSIPIEEILLIDRPAILKGTTHFNADVIFGEIQAPHYWLDGCNLQVVVESAGKINKRHLQKLNATIGNLKVKGALIVDDRVLSGRNNVDVLSILPKFVRKSTDQNIIAPVTAYDAYINNLFTKSVNGATWVDVLQKIKNQAKEKHNCTLRFASTLVADEVITKNLLTEDLTINDIRLADIERNGVLKNYKGIVLGTKEFFSNISVKGNLISNEISDIPTKELIPLHMANFGTELRFINEVTIAEDIVTDRLVSIDDSLDVFEELKSIDFETALERYENVSLHITGDVLFKKLNGLSPDDLVLAKMRLQVISGPHTFEGGMFVKGNSHINTMNGINVDDLVEREFEAIVPLKISSSSRKYTEVSRPADIIGFLQNIAQKTEQLNDLNEEYTKGLHLQLLAINERFSIPVPGIVKKYLLDLPSESRIYAIVQENGNHCLRTHVIKLDDNKKLSEGNKFYEGIFVPFQTYPGTMSYLYTHCESNQYLQTTILSLHMNNSGNAVVTQDFSDIGVVTDAKLFSSENKNFLVFLTKWGEPGSNNHSLIVLTVGGGFRQTWTMNFDTLSRDYNIITVEERIYLAISVNAFIGLQDIQSKVMFFKWNSVHEEFNLLTNISSGERAGPLSIAKMNNDLLLFVGQAQFVAPACKQYDYQRGVKVYRKHNRGDNFEPFTSLPVQNVASLENFNVDGQLYIAVATYENLFIFQHVPSEEFKQIKKYPLEGVSDISYFKKADRHFLILLSSKRNLIIFELEFRGVDLSKK